MPLNPEENESEDATLLGQPSIQASQKVVGKKRDVNDVLLVLGAVGKYQIWTFIWCSLSIFATAIIHLVVVFTHADMNFKCTDPRWNATNSTNQCQLDNDTTIECQHFSYSSPYFQSTIVSTFNLVCDRAYLSTLVDSLYLICGLPGGIIANSMNDKLGRKTTSMISLCALCSLGFAQAFSVNISMYMVFRILVIIPMTGVYDGLNTLMLEVTSPKRRAHLVLGIVMFWAFGIGGLSVLGYIFRDWSLMTLACCLPAGLLFLASYWIFDESPHWLYSNKKLHEAQAIIDKIAKWNNYKGPRHLITLTAPDNYETTEGSNTVIDRTSAKGNCVAILKAKKILIHMTILTFCWFALMMGYNGLSFGLADLAGDIYINNAIGGGVEIVAYIIAYFMILTGRRKMFMSLTGVGGVSLIACAIIENFVPGIVWLIITTSMLGRLTLAAGWQVLYMWTLEMLPTGQRTVLKASTQMVGTIGSALAPFINDAHKFITSPFVRSTMIAPMVYGVILASTTLLGMFLPETNNRRLPITIQDANVSSFQEASETSQSDNEGLAEFGIDNPREISDSYNENFAIKL